MPRFFLRNRDRLGFYAEIEIIFGAVRLNILYDFAEIFDLYSYPNSEKHYFSTGSKISKHNVLIIGSGQICVRIRNIETNIYSIHTYMYSTIQVY